LNAVAKCCLGPHTMSFPWKYRTVSAGREIVGCQTNIADPDEDGNGEVSNALLLLFTYFSQFVVC